MMSELREMSSLPFPAVFYFPPLTSSVPNFIPNKTSSQNSQPVLFQDSSHQVGEFLGGNHICRETSYSGSAIDRPAKVEGMDSQDEWWDFTLLAIDELNEPIPKAYTIGRSQDSDALGKGG